MRVRRRWRGSKATVCSCKLKVVKSRIWGGEEILFSPSENPTSSSHGEEHGCGAGKKVNFGRTQSGHVQKNILGENKINQKLLHALTVKNVVEERRLFVKINK